MTNILKELITLRSSVQIGPPQPDTKEAGIMSYNYPCFFIFTGELSSANTRLTKFSSEIEKQTKVEGLY